MSLGCGLCVPPHLSSPPQLFSCSPCPSGQKVATQLLTDYSDCFLKCPSLGPVMLPWGCVEWGRQHIKGKAAVRAVGM